LVPLGILLLPGIGHSQFRTGWRLLLCWAGVALLVVLVAIVAIGADALGQPFLGYRQAAVGLGPMGRSTWSPLANLRAAADPLRFDMPYLALGLAGAPYLWRQSRQTAILHLVWTGAAVTLLSVYSPLAAKHVVYVLPPVAILAGLCVSAVVRHCATRPHWRSLLGLVPTACALIWLGALLPAVGDVNRRLVAREELWLNPNSDVADSLRVITAGAGPDDYVLTDDQRLSFLSRRKVPPSLVDISTTRIRSGLLTGEHVVAEGQRYRPAVVVFWADRLRRLRAARAWVPRGYRITRTYEDGRALYVREDLLPRLTALQWWPTDRGVGVRFGTALVLEHARLLPGRRTTERYVELVWRAGSDVADPPKIQIQLRDTARRPVWKTRTSLLPDWQPAPWPGEPALLQRLPIDLADLPPGEYAVDVSVWADKVKDPLRVSAPSAAPDLVDRQQRAALIGRVYR
jgi:hypothetical protein